MSIYTCEFCQRNNFLNGSSFGNHKKWCSLNPNVELNRLNASKAALASKHQRVCKSTHEYIDKFGRIFKFDSRWEDYLADRLDELDIRWDRPEPIIYTEDGRKYFADFYLPDYNLYLDPKNDYAFKTQLPKLIAVSNLVNLILLHSADSCKTFTLEDIDSKIFSIDYVLPIEPKKSRKKKEKVIKERKPRERKYPNGRITIFKDDEKKYCDSAELEYILNDGWTIKNKVERSTEYYREISKMGHLILKKKRENSEYDRIYRENHKLGLPDNHQKGEKNSQFGKKFKHINKDGIKKRILESDYDKFIEDGWKPGWS